MTPKRPTVAFSFQLLDYLEALLLECQVAVSDFTAALKIMSASPFMKVQGSSLGCTVALKLIRMNSYFLGCEITVPPFD